MIALERVDNAAVLRLSRGIINPINLDLIGGLSATLHGLKEDPAVGGLVLASANDKFFSIGFDIPELIRLSREGLAFFFNAFNQLCLDLYTFPKPTVAAVTGHAVAGGFILAICCDYRLLARGHKLMGMNEVKLGIPVPYATGCILRELAGSRNAREIMDGGEFYGPDDAARLGVADKVLPLEQVLPHAIDRARRLGSEPQLAFALTKRILTEPLEQRVRPRLADTNERFLDCWFAETAQARLKEAAEKFRN